MKYDSLIECNQDFALFKGEALHGMLNGLILFIFLFSILYLLHRILKIVYGRQCG